MTVAEGKFRLYTSITPPLEAGDWQLVASQNLSAETSTGPLGSGDLRVDNANINLRVKSPRYLMPPDQVLSTYPPANSFGGFGSRLPQVVIKRRTLPWERALNAQPRSTPWLALVLITEGEARLDTGEDIANCVTPGITLDGVADVQKGNRLVVRKSVIDKVFPTRNDVPLLAHAREVDISDTELMMGDDDGFLAVVISNRLPLPAKDDNGDEVPVKYLACLINLERQFDALLEQSPDPAPSFFTEYLTSEITYVATATQNDHQIMGTAASPDRVNINDLEISAGAVQPAPLAPGGAAGSSSLTIASGAAATLGVTTHSAASQWSVSAQSLLTSSEVMAEMARDFRVVVQPDDKVLDPEFRFPVLMHWSFTSTGAKTFRSLMNKLDSGLLGDVGAEPMDLTGRLPLEVVESGHVGLGHKTREGDDVRSWYRGPLLPHPADTRADRRLPLAHSSDQLRIVIQDGREDLSLAAAFEVGRLLSLSQPSIIASLMRWRQNQYQAARMEALLDANRPFWKDVLGDDFALEDFYTIGPAAGRFLIDAIVGNPESFLGAPRPLVTPGRPLQLESTPTDALAVGLGMERGVIKGDIGAILEKVRAIEVPAIDIILDDIGTIGVREGLETVLDTQRIDLVSNSLSTQFANHPITGPTFPVINEINEVIIRDALDAILDISDDTDDENQP